MNSVLLVAVVCEEWLFCALFNGYSSSDGRTEGGLYIHLNAHTSFPASFLSI